MSIDRETLMAFIDGELPDAEAAHVAKSIEADPALMDYVARQRELKNRLKTDFAAILTEPVPSRIENAILNAPAPKERKRVSTPLFSFGWLRAGAMAAAVAAGILIAPFFGSGESIVSEGGVLVARGPLANALSTMLASEPDSSQATRIGLTFRDKMGGVCRSFTSGQSSGIACRGGAEWRIAALSSVEATVPGTYQPAGSAMPPALRETLNALIDGMPFDAAAERAARDAGWIAQ